MQILRSILAIVGIILGALVQNRPTTAGRPDIFLGKRLGT